MLSMIRLISKLKKPRFLKGIEYPSSKRNRTENRNAYTPVCIHRIFFGDNIFGYGSITYAWFVSTFLSLYIRTRYIEKKKNPNQVEAFMNISYHALNIF